jgi:hypothetical protein
MARDIAARDLCMGAPILRAHALWKRLRKRTIVVREVDKRILVLDVRPFLAKRAVPRVLSELAQLGWGLYRRFELGRRSLSGRHLALETVARFPEDVDALGRAFASGFAFSVRRTADFLNWRYAEAPVAYEKCLLRDGGRLVGYAVFRVGTMNGRRLLFLLEAAAVESPRRYYERLLAHVAAAAMRHGVSDVQTLESGCPVFAEALDAWGYRRKREEVPVVGACKVPWAEEICGARWWLTAGDGEFEFIFFNQGADELRGD